MLNSYSTEIILEVKSLSKKFTELEAVKDISFEILRGEMFGMVGPDGAGKTTMIRMICGLLTPTSGEINLFGQKVVRSGKSTQKRIGYLSQKFSLYGDLSVDENIDFFAQIHGRKDFYKDKSDLLEMTRLTEFKKRPAEKLSGGMKQKLALACCLIHQPDILFLDEPTTGVDPVSRRDFWKILSRLKQDGITIVMATPYLDEAERCDRVAMFNEGRIITLDTPSVLRQNAGIKVFEIVTHQTRTAAKIIINRFHIVPQLFGDRLHLLISEDVTISNDILEALSSENIEVLDSGYTAPSLENIFIKHVEEAGASV